MYLIVNHSVMMSYVCFLAILLLPVITQKLCVLGKKDIILNPLLTPQPFALLDLLWPTFFVVRVIWPLEKLQWSSSHHSKLDPMLFLKLGGRLTGFVIYLVECWLSSLLHVKFLYIMFVTVINYIPNQNAHHSCHVYFNYFPSAPINIACLHNPQNVL